MRGEGKGEGERGRGEEGGGGGRGGGGRSRHLSYSYSTRFVRLHLFQLLLSSPPLSRTTEYTELQTAAFWRTFSHEGKISPGW